MIEINGEPVEPGDIVYLGFYAGLKPLIFLALPVDERQSTDLREIDSSIVAYFLGDDEKRALYNVKARVVASGARSFIWHRKEWALRSPSPPPEAKGQPPITVKPMDFLDALNSGRRPNDDSAEARQWRLGANGVLIHHDTWVNLDLAAERLGDLMTKRALGK